MTAKIKLTLVSYKTAKARVKYFAITGRDINEIEESLIETMFQAKLTVAVLKADIVTEKSSYSLSGNVTLPDLFSENKHLTRFVSGHGKLLTHTDVAPFLELNPSWKHDEGVSKFRHIRCKI